MGRWLVFAALIPACYRPALEAPCSASCDTAGAPGACPGEQVCGSDLRCHAAGDAECALQPDAPGQICVGHAFLKVCFVPNDDVVLEGPSINTDDDHTCSVVIAGTPPVCAIVGNNVFIGTGVQVTGTRAFAIAAADTLTIRGSLDGSSHAGGQSGPGATTPAKTCNPPTPAVSGGTGSGGAGGSFQATGGGGGKGAGTGATGGTASNTVPLAGIVGLSGPCLADAGSDTGGGNAGDKGFGGGAIALLASNLSIIGIVNASGGGGAAGRRDNGGGGGGGAGGMILLDADTIAVSGIVVANGGGGGGGAGSIPTGADGMPGSDPGVTPPLIGGAGGVSSQLGGVGGPGGGITQTQGSLGLPSTTNGAGGGGGGVGYILTTMPISSGMLSPAPSPI